MPQRRTQNSWESDYDFMTITRQTDNNKVRPKWVTATIFSVIIVALLAAYALLTTPGIIKPGEVTITGTVTAQGVTLNKIVFTNTGCGTRNEAAISAISGASGTYTISLDNGYSYNISLAWTDLKGIAVETKIGTLSLDTFDKSLVRDWALQP